MITRIFALYITTAFSLLAQTNTSTSPRGYETVPLGEDRVSGHYTVDVQIERKPLRFGIDYGLGKAIVLSTPTAKALRKRTISAGAADGVTGKVTIRKTKLKSFEVIGLSPVLKDSDAFVIDLGELLIHKENQPSTPDGLLGVSVLDQWNAVIDIGMRRLLIPYPRLPGTSFTQWMHRRGAFVAPLQKSSDGFTMLDLTIKKKTYTFLVDVGAGLNTIEPAVAKRLRLQVVDEAGDAVRIGDKAAEGLAIAEADDVVLGGAIEVKKLQFRVYEHVTKIILPAGKTYGGILGSRALAAMNASLDFGTYSLIVPKPEDAESGTAFVRGLTTGKLKRPFLDSEKNESATNPEPPTEPGPSPQPLPVERGF